MGFLIGFGLFFLAILFTVIFGGVSKMGDRRVALEGRPSRDQRLPTEQGASMVP
jgi:hypothetical protein